MTRRKLRVLNANDAEFHGTRRLHDVVQKNDTSGETASLQPHSPFTNASSEWNRIVCDYG